ncbi:UDP-glucose dehydrogenase family protein [Candidatus Poriferisodalis sp.]|uniref:UDP-glucose dehydrogenase family protein n=1 Tax=Candidatus Poriferisodalis sp. TaxID=3101277 RepID=UPI003B01DE8C
MSDTQPSGRILVVGAGYVGLTTAACLAHLGHDVICADIDQAKVASLSAGVVPIREADLDRLVAEGIARRRLRFVTSAEAVAAACEFVFVCVPTPLRADGETELGYLFAALESVASRLRPGSVVVTKSTVPVGTSPKIAAALGRTDVALASNPEFLREGSAVADFLAPDRIVIGAEDGAATRRVAALYANVEAPMILCDPTSAETVKYAANAFLAAKVSFVNALAAVCEAVDADVDTVLAGVGTDHRIGTAYLQPGPGWGGSCLPKDTRALVSVANDAGYVFDLLEGVIAVNEQQLDRVVAKVAGMAAGRNSDLAAERADGRSSDVADALHSVGLDGVTVALLGLTFKAGTDDLRGSPALRIAELLRTRGARLAAYDPAMRSLEDRPDIASQLPADMELRSSAYGALQGADVAVVLTEWPEFAALDWKRAASEMATARVVDARNLLDARQLRSAGFVYEGLGRR